MPSMTSALPQSRLPVLDACCRMATALVGACGAAAGDVALDALRRCAAAPLASRRASIQRSFASCGADTAALHAQVS